jgi:putative spermidine/putrescine transport system permease protein
MTNERKHTHEDDDEQGHRLGRFLIVAPIWAFILAPIAAVFIASIGTDAIPRLPPRGFSFHWYRLALQQGDVLAALKTSAIVASGSSCLALLVAVPAAYAIVRYRFPGRRLAEALLTVPIIIPQIVIGIGLLIFFSRYGALSTVQQLIVAHAIVIVPFVARIMVASFEGVDRSLEEAAQVLGASAPGAFLRITLPLARFGVFAAAGMAFIISFTQFTVSLFIYSGDSPPYPIWIYQSLSSDYTPMIPIAVSGIVIACIVILVLIIGRLSDVTRAVGVHTR